MSPTPPTISSSPSSEPLNPSTLSIPPQAISTPQDPLRRLLDETSDLIDSPTATHILTLLLDTLFSHLTDQVLRVQAFKIPLPSTSEDPTQRFTEIIEPSDSEVAGAKAKLATILAVVTRQAHAIGNGVSNEYVQAMEGVRELEAFAAVVYSSHFQVEGIVGATSVEEAPVGGGVIEEKVKAGVEKVREGVDDVVGVTAEVSSKVGGAVGGVFGATWGIWESVWGKVTGGGGEGGEAITG